MCGLLRSCKDATFRAERVMGVSVLMAVVFCFYFEFLNGGRFTLENLVSKLPMTLMLISVLMFGLYGMMDIATYTQVAMSYGCTRKNAVLGVIWMQILEIVEVKLLLTVMAYVIPKDWQLMDIMYQSWIVLALTIFASAVSLPLGVLIRRFGKVAYIVIVLIMTLIGGAIGGLVGFMSAENDWITIFAVGAVPFVMVGLIVSVVLYIICAILFWLLIRKLEVRV